MREQQHLSRWRRKASGTVRRTSVAARVRLERPPSSRSRWHALVLLLGLAMTSRAAFAGGNPVTVTTLLDEETSGDGKCSLREAIKNINAQGELTHGDCATGLGSGSIDFDVSGTVMLTLGVLSIGGAEPSLTIEGGNSVTVDGGGANQIFDVNTLVYLNDLTVMNGFAPDGGAASVAGALRVTNCKFVGNNASALGGAIYATDQAKLQFTDCTFDSNTASQSGGAIYNGAALGQMIVTTSAFSSNKASAVSGGAIYNDGSATTIDNSTFQTNTANSRGGAVYNTRTMTVTASTFSNNGTAGSTNGGAIGNGPGASTAIVNSTFAGNLGFSGGGTFNSGGVTEIHFCTFSGNSANDGGAIFDQSSAPAGTAVGESILASSTSGGNCASGGRIVDGNYNISDDHTCGFTGTGAQGQAIGDGVNPALDPAGLKDNGGPTATIAEQASSPSVDAVSHQSCAIFGAMGADQRGQPRPDPEDAFSGVCDIGAYELQQAPVPTATPTITQTPIGTATSTPTPRATPTAFQTLTSTATPNVSPTRTEIPTVTNTPERSPSRTATRTPTRTQANGTPTATPTITPSPTAKSCVGDCNGTGTVSIDELIKMVNIALGGTPPSSCPNGIPDEPVTIDELIKGVNNALGGCQK